ncbi:MAG: RNA methyltransferase [Candidatus Cloacimonetes bacterium]|nr:RNA methyltransferase [Candidatus Cloacimonadota bacterium]MCF7814477.1 RNA methyltransferase [Candidatus Cloacimonadota bacterium]MCF7867869.1 RNA methyltransferase [Candidatus Cloacimonadota bacterium]MCF7883688.1 RNA methyltransferase [Candidatus Cloacimonadota bacterium]
MQEITKNQLKDFARLQQKKYRQQFGKVIVEGKRTIELLIENHIHIDTIFYSDEADLPDNIASVTEQIKLQNWQMEKITATKNPQNIAALLPTETPKINSRKFLLYLDNIKEPGNLGTIFRTASAAGLDGIVLSPDCCEIFNPKVIRSSLGTVFVLPSEVHDLDWLQKQRAQIFVSTLQNAKDLGEVERSNENCILVLGSEAEGVRPEIYEMGFENINIPISSNVESLNVAVAAGIMIFQLKNT